MGFLKKIILLIITLLLSGCGKSLMKFVMKPDPDAYTMFGKSPSRDFYVPVDVSDSLNLKWEESAYGSFPNSSVTISNDIVFINDLAGRVFAYNIETGKQVGMLKYKGAVYSTPLLYPSKIIFPSVQEKDHITELVFYNYDEGKEIDVEEIEGKILSEMIHLENSFIFLTDNGTLYKYNTMDREEWKTKTNKRTHCSPSLKDNIIIFGNDVGEIIAIDLNSGDSLYVKKIGGIFNGAPTIDGNTVYMSNDNGKLYSINLKYGKLNWEFNTGSRILMTPASDDKNLIVGNLAGELFSLNKNTGKLNWKNSYGGIFNATPLLTNNRIIIPDSFLAYYFIDKSNGKVVKKISLDGRARLTPVYFKNLLFIGYDNGNLRAYEFVE
jgi:outer membrane protein assembly factor BamB